MPDSAADSRDVFERHANPNPVVRDAILLEPRLKANPAWHQRVSSYRQNREWEDEHMANDSLWRTIACALTSWGE
jgi:hypothetical protein